MVQGHWDHIPRIIVCFSSRRHIQILAFWLKTSFNSSIVFRFFWSMPQSPVHDLQFPPAHLSRVKEASVMLSFSACSLAQSWIKKSPLLWYMSKPFLNVLSGFLRSLLLGRSVQRWCGVFLPRIWNMPWKVRELLTSASWLVADLLSSIHLM